MRKTYQVNYKSRSMDNVLCEFMFGKKTETCILLIEVVTASSLFLSLS